MTTVIALVVGALTPALAQEPSAEEAGRDNPRATEGLLTAEEAQEQDKASGQGMGAQLDMRPGEADDGADRGGGRGQERVCGLAEQRRQGAGPRRL